MNRWPILVDQNWSRKLRHRHMATLQDDLERCKLAATDRLDAMPDKTKRKRAASIRAARAIMREEFTGLILGEFITPGKRGKTVYLMFKPGARLMLEFVTLDHFRPDHMMSQFIPVCASQHAIERFFERANSTELPGMLREFTPGLVLAANLHANDDAFDFVPTPTGALICIATEEKEYPVLAVTWLHISDMEVAQLERRLKMMTPAMKEPLGG